MMVLVIHIVKDGDTPYSIAQEYGVSLSGLIADNGLAAYAYLPVGLAVVVASDTVRYTVKQGDSLYTIAREYDTTVRRILEANPRLNENAQLAIGQQITVPLGRDIRGSLDINGFAYPSIADQVLQNTLPFLTYLSVFSYSVNEDGSLVDINDDAVLDRIAGTNVTPMMVVTNIEPGGGFSSDRLQNLFANSAAVSDLVDNIINTMEDKGFTALNVDFEYVYQANREDYNNFLRTLKERFLPLGYILTSSLAPKLSANQQGLLYEAHDYAAHGEICDYVIIMTYEWGFAYGPPLPVAPIGSVEDVIKYAVSEIPSEKILMGIPNYGYDWVLPYRPGTAARTLSLSNCVQIAIQENTDIMFDNVSQSPFLSYYDMNGQEHITWFEDARSIQAKLELIEKYNLAGPSYWTVMTYFAPNWTLIRTQYDVRKNI